MGDARSDKPDAERIIVFGDSLSDLGTYKRAAIAHGVPEGGKFTINPGPIWIENVAAHYGLTITANRTAGFGNSPEILGGTGYAEGGARVAEQPGSFNTDAISGPDSGPTTLPVRDQISAHLSQKGRFKPTDLVFVWVGTNDVFRPIAFAPVPVDSGIAQLRKAADDLAVEVERLKANGASKIVVLNLDDLGQTPAVALDVEARSFATTLSGAFNSRLASNLNRAGDVVLVDIQTMFAGIRENPAEYELENLSDPACRPHPDISGYSIICTKDSLVAPNANNTHIYADTVHYTDKINHIISDYVIKTVGNFDLK